MPLLDSILPPDTDPTLRHIMNGLLIFHIIAFLFYMFLLTRSFLKKNDNEQLEIDSDDSDDTARRKLETKRT